MKKLWDPIDRFGYVLFKWWTPQLQVRTGVLSVLLGIGLALYGPWSGEPILIYEMSALALFIGGLGVLVTAVLAVREDPEMQDNDLNPDTDDQGRDL